MATGPARALDPTRSLAQFTHTTWTLADGAPPGIQAIAQSKDGFLWLGTTTGLYRFDGVTFERMPSYDGPGAPRSDSVTALFTSRSGDVWVGHYWGGISVYRNGKLRDANPGKPHGIVFQFVQAPDGAIWAAVDGIRGAALFRYANGRWDVVGSDWNFPKAHLRGVLAAADGSLWVSLTHQILRLPPGSRRFSNVGANPGGAWDPVQSRDGRVWLASPGEVKAPSTLAAPLSPAPLDSSQRRIGLHVYLVDRDGVLWSINAARGVVRNRDAWPGSIGKAESNVEYLGPNDGVAGGVPLFIMEDQEGNIWIGTSLGLTRIRPANVVTELRSTMNFEFRASIVKASRAGVVYIGISGEHYRKLFRVSPQDRPAALPKFAGLDHGVCRDLNDGMWLTSDSELIDFRPELAGRIALPAGPMRQRMHVAMDCLQTDDGAFWLSIGGAGLYRLTGSGWQEFVPLPDLKGVWPWAMAEDSQGRALMYFGTRSLIRITGEKVETLWDAKDISIGFIHSIYVSGQDILMGGDFGFAKYDGKLFHVLRAKDFPFLAHVSGILQTSSHDTWLLTSAGVVRLSTAELNRAFETPDAALHPQILGAADGLPGIAQDGPYNDIAEGRDGRLWFATTDGVAWIDPNHLYHNPLPPPVSIRSLTANGMTYLPTAGLKLPSGVANIEIDYTALSLQAPERIRFRYRLEGVDKDWVDPGARRQAFYTGLQPKHYRFQVIAANNDGVWNRTGATLDFSIKPTFIQSKLFLGLCILAGLALLWCLYTLRLRQIASRVRLLMQERLAERERIARELHDTFLQSTQGLILRFQAVANRISPDQPAAAMMEQALVRADEVLAEGRDRVVDLRAAEKVDDLPKRLEDAAQRILSESAVKARLVIVGKPRRLEALVSEEVARIGEEFLYNTLKHANAQTVEIEIGFERKQLVVRFSDDGVGIDPSVLQSGGREGHFGLLGMRERAGKIHAKFTLASRRSGAGTELSLVVPGRVAYVNFRQFPWRLSAPEASALESSDV